MNKLFKIFLISFLSFLIVFLPISEPFSRNAKVQAENKTDFAAKPQGGEINSQLTQALLISHKNNIELEINQLVQKKPLIKLSQRDVGHVRGKDKKTGKEDSGDGEIDRRILKTLNYLVTPRELGGAGYQRLKIQRLMKGYDSSFSNRKASREYPEGNEPNLSVHSYGQAIDISEIDYIYSTLREYSLAKKKNKPQAPMPIKVAWQSEKGFEASGGMDTYNQSLQGLFAEYGFNSLNASTAVEIADLFGINLDLNNLSLNDLDNLAKILALQWLASSADMPDLDLSGIDPTHLSWGELSREMGRSYLAELLDVDPQGLRGKGLSEIKRNLGQAEVENRMGLPDGAMQTSTGKSQDILRQMALRRLEDDLELAKSSLKDLTTNPDTRTVFANAINMYNQNTPVRLDAVLGMPPGGNYTNTLKSGDTNAINNALFEIGAYFASQVLINNTQEQNAVYWWIRSNGQTTSVNGISIDETRLAGNMNLRAGDIENLFIKDGANAVFSRLGQTALLDGLGSAALENYDPAAQAYADFNFYKNTAQNLQSQVNNLKNQSGFSDIANNLAGIVNNLSVITGSKDANDIEADIRAMSEAARILSDFEINQQGDKPSEKIQQVENSINSFIEAINLPFLPDLEAVNLDIPDLEVYGTNISGEDLLDAILSDNPSESLEDIGIDILCGQWDNSWGLQTDTIKKLIHGENVSADMEKALGEIASSYINDELGTNFTGEDLQKLFKGDFKLLINMGGAMVDEALNLPTGSTAQIINEGGNADAILQSTGSLMIGQFLGLDFPVSLEGDFATNIGRGTIETRLGIPVGTFKNYANINAIVDDLGITRVAQIFHLELNGADQITSEVINNSADGISYINNILGLAGNSTKTKDFLLGGSPDEYAQEVGNKATIAIGADKILNYFNISDDQKGLIEEILFGEGWGGILPQNNGLINSDNWTWNNIGTILPKLAQLAGVDLEETTGLTQAEIQTVFNDSSKFGEVITQAGMRFFEDYIEQVAGVNIDGVTDLIKNYFVDGTWDNARFKDVLLDIAQKIAPGEYQGALNSLITGIAGGNTKEAMNTFSSALMEKFYNEQFPNSKVGFQEIKNMFTADPVLVNTWMQANGINPATATPEQRQMAERVARTQAQKDLQYKLMDAQLHELDSDIPADFSQTMFEGDPIARKKMFGEYLFSKLEKEIDIPDWAQGFYSQFKTDFLNGADITSKDYWQNLDFKNFAYGAIEGILRDQTGINFASGTIEALFKGNVSDALELNMTLISDYVDGWLGLPRGTTGVIWNAYNAYTTALNTYKIALSAAGADATKIAAAKADFNADIANIVVTIVTFVFQKQFAQIDQKLGLPAGTTSAVVGLGLTWLITGSIPIIGVLGLAYTLLFGVYKVRMFSTPCDYQPWFENAPPWMKMKNPDHPDELGILPSAFPYCPGEWKYKPEQGSNTFKDMAIKSAQYKVAMLVGDLLYMNENLAKQGDKIAGKNKNMQPIQILTLREEDRNRYLQKVVKEYGKTASQRGWRGIILSDKVWDVVHIGF